MNSTLAAALVITALIYGFIALTLWLCIKIEKKFFHSHYVKKHNADSRYYQLLDKEKIK